MIRNRYGAILKKIRLLSRILGRLHEANRLKLAFGFDAFKMLCFDKDGNKI